jgi:hypothetical protein
VPIGFSKAGQKHATVQQSAHIAAMRYLYGFAREEKLPDRGLAVCRFTSIILKGDHHAIQ